MIIKQFRYFGPNSELNTITPIDNKIKIQGYGYIYKIGVQALPGTHLKFTHSTDITIGQYGSYQLDLGKLQLVKEIEITIPIAEVDGSKVELIGNGIIVDVVCQEDNNAQ